jgi:hypothetical protein
LKVFVAPLKLPKEDDLLQQRLREEARALFLQKKNKELLSNEELDVSGIFFFKPLVMVTIIFVGLCLYKSKNK